MKNFLLLLLIIQIPHLKTMELEGLDDVNMDDDQEIGDLENVSSSVNQDSISHKQQTEEEKKEIVRKAMVVALKRPEGRKILGQVLPIVRLMSPPQRLALASLVMAQMLAGPGDSTTPTSPITKSENITSQLMLPISMDIANMFRGLARDQPQARSTSGFISELYQGGHRIRTAPGPNIRRPPPTLNGINRRNVNGNTDKVTNLLKRRPSLNNAGGGSRPTVQILKKPTIATPTSTAHSCTAVLSNELCLELDDYPEEEIINTIKKDDRPEAYKALLSEPSREMENDSDTKVLERRQGDVNPTPALKKHMCTSIIEFARPKKARSTSGQWKYIVNTGDYTQTLRLELCSKPQNPCNYLSEEVDSQCVQVYNYHRLLTWDEASGLTMDVFKVPTCCSCRVLGYGGIPFLQSTPEVTTYSPPLDNPDSNLVGNEETPAIRIPPLPTPTHNPSPPKGIRVRPFIPPKRETIRRPGTIMHRGPPLPLENESSHEDYRYPPYENTLRRFTRNNTIDRIKFKHPLLNSVPVTPNQRHPALPIDSLHADSMPVTNFSPTPTAPSMPSGSTSTSGGTTAPAKRVNYSYHPIIDYFRPQLQQQQQPQQSAESRLGLDWTPIINNHYPYKNLKVKV